MYQKQLDFILTDLKRTKKAIVAFGDSFTQGQGAIDQDIYENYEWKIDAVGMPMQIQTTLKEQNKLVKSHPELYFGPDGKLDFTFMEYKNSYSHVLADKYFNGQYTPINFGMRGCGNRASIKSLHFFPEINWNELEEIIIIYCPTDNGRFDFVNDQFNDHHFFYTMWPHYDGLKKKTAQRVLWEGYARGVWSEKFEILEAIINIRDLLWFKEMHNAKLIITPAFSEDYTKENFENHLSKQIMRIDNEIKKINENMSLNKRYVDLVPWENFFKPAGHTNFAKLTLAQEPSCTKYFWDYYDIGTPNHYLTKCAHPSAKSHDLFAFHLYNHIRNL